MQEESQLPKKYTENFAHSVLPGHFPSILLLAYSAKKIHDSSGLRRNDELLTTFLRPEIASTASCET